MSRSLYLQLDSETSKNIVAVAPLGYRGDPVFLPCRYPYRPLLESVPNTLLE